MPSSWVGVRVTDDRHPNDTSPGDHLTRYWTVDESSVTSFSCDVTCQYVDADINTVEGNIVGARWVGVNWTNLGPVNAQANTIEGTVSDFGDFTGVAGSPTAITLCSAKATKDDPCI